MEPFTSNDTYVCPDCDSLVKVGARSCPSCGPFLPMSAKHDDSKWEEADSWDSEESDGWLEDDKPVFPIHSMTTYSDNREILNQSNRVPTPKPSPIPEEESGVLKLPLYVRMTAAVLIVITFLSAAMAGLRIFVPR